MKIVDPLSPYSNRIHISDALRNLAAQEGCDGEPYDQMQDAADYIDKLESQLKQLQEAVMTYRKVAPESMMKNYAVSGLKQVLKEQGVNDVNGS